jgi:transcriptional regulator with XRE-family HTH domain
LHQYQGMNRDIGRLLGTRIHSLRKAAGLSQTQLAALMGKSVETISNFERGKTIPSVLTLTDLSDRLGVELKDCFDFQTSPKPLGAAEQMKARLDLLTPGQHQLVNGFVDMLIQQK